LVLAVGLCQSRCTQDDEGSVTCNAGRFRIAILNLPFHQRRQRHCFHECWRCCFANKATALFHQARTVSLCQRGNGVIPPTRRRPQHGVAVVHQQGDGTAPPTRRRWQNLICTSPFATHMLRHMVVHCCCGKCGTSTFAMHTLRHAAPFHQRGHRAASTAAWLQTMMIDCCHLKLDHSFKLTQCMQSNSSAMSARLLTVMNEFGEIVAHKLAASHCQLLLTASGQTLGLTAAAAHN